MKSPLADLYTSSDPVFGDYELVLKIGLPDPVDSPPASLVLAEEQIKLTVSKPDLPQETEPSVSEDQSHYEISRD